MIITRLSGGIGNQMFQYAAGRALAVRLGSELKLDLSWFDDMSGCTHRRYSLDAFCLNATTTGLKKISRSARRGMVGALLRRLETASRMHVARVEEPGPGYWTGFESLAGDLHLVGYWQSERYFSQIRSTLLREFSPASGPEGMNRDLAEEIASVEAVSVHVRRGDYVSDAKTNAHHGVCDLAYYHRAVAHVAERAVSPRLFVFSDDPAWVRENLRLSLPIVFVAHNRVDDEHEDLRLMSLCRHHIIANSSFSWWGAWLGEDPKKIVVAPQRWFANEERNRQTSDLIPAEWKVL